MKQRLCRVLGYYLYVQAFIGAINICGRPEIAAISLVLAGFSAWGGYALIQYANRPPELLPEPIPDTQPLSAIRHANNPTKPVEKL